jgi:putative ABC transport system substrate-binding protein
VRRREFITLLGGVAAWPLAARAQQPKLPVVGHLNVASLTPYSHLLAAFRESLKRAGWTEGVNVAFEYGWAEGHYDRLPLLAADLVRRQVTVIVASGGNAPAQAAKAATDIIPIVFVSGGEPIRGGLVASMNRPGANVTGVSTMFSALVPKRLDLLKQLVPTMRVVGALINPNYPDADLQRQELDDAAAAIGQQVRLREARSGSEIEAAFASFADSRVDALIAMNDPFFQSVHDQITALAAQYALPTIYWDREFAAGGGLVSYGPSLTDAFRQAAIYVARILRGEKAGDLPVQQPTKFELVLNVKTAKALGLEVPATVLAIADEVIE